LNSEGRYPKPERRPNSDKSRANAEIRSLIRASGSACPRRLLLAIYRSSEFIGVGLAPSARPEGFRGWILDCSNMSKNVGRTSALIRPRNRNFYFEWLYMDPPESADPVRHSCIGLPSAFRAARRGTFPSAGPATPATCLQTLGLFGVRTRNIYFSWQQTRNNPITTGVL